jgi:hypothetical protein
MHIAGSRRILAPPHRVQTALTDPDFLTAALPQPLASQAHLAEPASAGGIVWQLQGGEAKFQLTPGQEDSTQLAYDADAEGDNESRLKNSIETFLDTLQSEVAGPRETGAQGPLVAAANAAQSGFPFRAMPNLIFGMPLIFWAGSAIFFFIFIFMFSAYL